MRIDRLVATGVGDGDPQLVRAAGQAFLVEVVMDDRSVVHLEQGVLPVDLAPVAGHAAQVVGEAKGDPFSPGPVLGSEGGDGRRLRVGADAVGTELADVGVDPPVAIDTADPARPPSPEADDTVLPLVGERVVAQVNGEDGRPVERHGLIVQHVRVGQRRGVRSHFVFKIKVVVEVAFRDP